LNERVTILAVLSWHGAWGGLGSWREQDHFSKQGIGFPFLHDGPISPIARGTPTTIIFDKSGKAVAWRIGSCDWAAREVRTLLEALLE